MKSYIEGKSEFTAKHGGILRYANTIKEYLIVTKRILDIKAKHCLRRDFGLFEFVIFNLVTKVRQAPESRSELGYRKKNSFLSEKNSSHFHYLLLRPDIFMARAEHKLFSNILSKRISQGFRDRGHCGRCCQSGPVGLCGHPRHITTNAQCLNRYWRKD